MAGDAGADDDQSYVFYKCCGIVVWRIILDVLRGISWRRCKKQNITSTNDVLERENTILREMRDKNGLLQEKVTTLEEEVKKERSNCEDDGMRTTKKNCAEVLKTKPVIIIQPRNAQEKNNATKNVVRERLYPVARTVEVEGDAKGVNGNYLRG